MNTPPLYHAMSSPPAVIYFSPADGPPSADVGRDSRVAQLESHGFSVAQCADMAQLYALAKKAVGSAAVSAVVLASSHADNCIVATQLRALYPSLGVVALMESSAEAVLLQALQSGVDHYCPAQASSQLLVAILFRLLWRMDVTAASRMACMSRPIWSLPEQAWILSSPDGQRIPLTTGERAFLMTLMAAPNQRAAHADLIQAVNDAYDLDSQTSMQSRISVLVSRLRRKCAEHGVGLPVKSVHNWGYMFTGPV